MAAPREGRWPHQALDALDEARTFLTTTGIALPTWTELLNGAGPPQPPQRLDSEGLPDPGEWQHGWQYYTTSAQQLELQRQLEAAAPREDQARLRSCRGRNSSKWLTAIPYQEMLTLSNPILQCLLRRRLGMAVLADAEECEGRSCRAPGDALGHHRASCTRTGRIHGRHAAAIAPWRQVLHEAGYRTRCERLLRDTHLPTDPRDQRRMDIVASPGSRSMGARRGVALFCDVTLVAVHTQNGAARPGGVHTDGSVVSQAVARKRRKYADVANHPGRHYWYSAANSTAGGAPTQSSY